MTIGGRRKMTNLIQLTTELHNSQTENGTPAVSTTPRRNYSLTFTVRGTSMIQCKVAYYLR
jgi:hypothetical protein